VIAPFVARDDTCRIAEDELKANRGPDCDGVEKRYTISELEECMIRRPCVYGLPTEALRRRWIAYAGRSAYCMVASSDVIIVAQETGEVVFCGLANVEG
jgi:hypothetical protein